VLGDWTPASGHRAMGQLLDLPQPPTAVLACNDLMAIGAMGAARARGRAIPQDVALVGFDDIPAASWLSPSLSTIAQFPYEMGERLATALFERMVGGYEGPGRRFEVACQFTEREST
jgi:DNA-binding LacI/PurR family transcriptional regulator